LPGGLAALLIAFAISMAFQARRIARERDRANTEREASEKVSTFLANMLGSVNPEELGNTLWTDLRERAAAARRKSGATEAEGLGLPRLARQSSGGVSSTQTGLNLLDQQILARAGKTIATQMAGEPRIAGRLEDTLGRTYLLLGLLPQAETHLKTAVDIRTRAFGADSPDTVKSMRGLGLVYGGRATTPRRKRSPASAWRRCAARSGSEHPDTLSAMQTLGTVYYWEQRYDEAEKLLRESLDGRRRVLGPDHRDTRGLHIALGMVLSELKRYPEAEKLLREQVEFDRKAGTSNEPDAIGTVMNLAICYEQQGRFSESRKLQEEVLARFQKRLGPDHPDTVYAMINIASTYRSERLFAEAEAAYRETLEATRRVLGPEHPETLKTMSDLADVEANLGKNREAEALYRRALDGRRRVLGPEAVPTLNVMNGLAEVLLALGDAPAAQSLLDEALKIERRVLPADHALLLSSLTDLARVRSARGYHAEAAALASEAIAGYERGKDVEGTASARLALGRALTGLRAVPGGRARAPRRGEGARRQQGRGPPAEPRSAGSDVPEVGPHGPRQGSRGAGRCVEGQGGRALNARRVARGRRLPNCRSDRHCKDRRHRGTVRWAPGMGPSGGRHECSARRFGHHPTRPDRTRPGTQLRDVEGTAEIRGLADRQRHRRGAGEST
jgi:tetratricopeptide (TPR) repeat protein